MNKRIAIFLGVAAVLFFSVGQLHAVKPPSVEKRQQAQSYKKKQERKQAKEQRRSGCKYGKDKVTGKCYQPKEGQLYRDPNTGKLKMKEIEKVNLPWD